MDMDKVVTILTIWLVAGLTIFLAGWYAVIPITAAFIGTIAIISSD